MSAVVRMKWFSWYYSWFKFVWGYWWAFGRIMMRLSLLLEHFKAIKSKKKYFLSTEVLNTKFRLFTSVLQQSYNTLLNNIDQKLLSVLTDGFVALFILICTFSVHIYSKSYVYVLQFVLAVIQCVFFFELEYIGHMWTPETELCKLISTVHRIHSEFIGNVFFAFWNWKMEIDNKDIDLYRDTVVRYCGQ